MQTRNKSILLVKPANFKLNRETAIDNAFQSNIHSLSDIEIYESAINEFEGLKKKLQDHGVSTFVLEDTKSPEKPDAIFPNNWFITDQSSLYLFPMKAKNRRLERSHEAIEFIKNNFKLDKIIDLTDSEKNNLFLEGTGSLVFDHDEKVVYCALSERANKELLLQFSSMIKYTPCFFKTLDPNMDPIYHTNVMMAVLKTCVVYCEEVFASVTERKQFERFVERSDKEPVVVTYEQMCRFTCNILQVNEFVFMSERAHQSLNAGQLKRIKSSGQIVHSPLYTIEDIGGGGCRCMMAEVFLPTAS